MDVALAFFMIITVFGGAEPHATAVPMRLLPVAECEQQAGEFDAKLYLKTLDSDVPVSAVYASCTITSETEIASLLEKGVNAALQ